jgi:exosortase C (VPDSG-CTERM-specific)
MQNSSLPLRRQVVLFVIFMVALSACFFSPLLSLAEYSHESEFFSYIPLIPLITVYLIWLKKSELPKEVGNSWKWGAVWAVLGIVLLVGWACVLRSDWIPGKEDHLTLTTAAYLMFVVGGCLALFGVGFTKAIAFPLAFLIFMVPMPTAMLDRTEMFFQETSAVTAAAFLKAAFMPVFRDDLTLNLPGFAIIVAPECSGIHSTMVLLITSVLAGDLFLRSKWKRLFLVVFVLPLAIVRNGFRIFVISELCVRVSHDMINSPIHRKGGPIFFALFLIPFLGVLYLLWKSEQPHSKTVETKAIV